MSYVRRFLARRNARLGGPLDPGDLEDLAQEVFLRVWRGRAGFRHEATLEAWVGRFCLLTLVDELRQRRVRAMVSLDDHEVSSRELEQVEERIDLQDTPILLPELEARAVMLRLHAALTYADAAHRLGCSQTAVKAAYGRGLERIRYQLCRPRGARRACRSTAMRLLLSDDGALAVAAAATTVS
ncbi:MAG: RNA polymerase sigma factor [Planctomycetota bacterium]